jgi:GT2 family glycosyltransferase
MGLAVETTKRVGLFDEDSRFKAAAEDNEWSYRALRAGVPIIYAPDVIVTHLDWRDDFQLLKTYQAYAWGQGVFYGKYLRKADWFIALRTALYFYRGIKLYITGLTRNDFDQRVYGHARLTHFIPGVLAGLRAKR